MLSTTRDGLEDDVRARRHESLWWTTSRGGSASWYGGRPYEGKRRISEGEPRKNARSPAMSSASLSPGVMTTRERPASEKMRDNTKALEEALSPPMRSSLASPALFFREPMIRSNSFSADFPLGP